MEKETIQKQYTKVLDAYGCLGVLNLSLGKSVAGVHIHNNTVEPVIKDPYGSPKCGLI